MRQIVARPRANLAITMIAIAPLLIAGCHKLQPQGGDPTMQLLHDGSDKVCVAADVQKALRTIILPRHVHQEDDEVTPEEVDGAAATVAVTYELTTLQSFDKSVSKATCSTTVAIRDASGSKSSRFPLEFMISPSAENPAMFVVTAGADAAHAFAATLIDEELQREGEKEEAHQQAQATQDAKRKLLTTINERWLGGAWIGTNQASESCGNGSAVWFEPNHVLEGGMGKGRWALNEDKLHLVAQTNPGPIDVTATITQADQVSLAFTGPDGAGMALRRCSRQEIETLPQADVPAGNGAGQ